MSRKLRIGVDVRDLRIATTGTATYLQELCKQFKSMEGMPYTFYFFDTWFPVYTGENKLLKIMEHGRLQFWKQVLLPIKAWFKNCDIVFCTDNIVPYFHLGFKPIPVIHDAFLFENPEHYNKIWLWFYKNIAIPAARRAAFVITPTYYAKERIHYYTNIQMDKLITIYEGPKTLDTKNKRNQTDLQVLSKHKFEAGKYILHVGIMEKRKNIPALIYAFKKIKDCGFDIQLVLAGKADSKKQNNDSLAIAKAIQDCELQEDVIMTGFLSETDLAYVYSGALMYVFPSVNEGFGIPILEAFTYKLPVLVAQNTCLPEVGGDAVLAFDPFDINDIFLKMKMVLDNDELKTDLIKKGQIRLKEFSWNKTAHQLVEVFDKA